MKTKRIICITLYLTVIVLLTVVLVSVTVIKTSDRQKTYIPPKSLKTMVSDDTRGMDIEQIIDYSLKLTSSLLQFSYHNDLDNGKVNCIGYAQRTYYFNPSIYGVLGVKCLTIKTRQ